MIRIEEPEVEKTVIATCDSCGAEEKTDGYVESDETLAPFLDEFLWDVGWYYLGKPVRWEKLVRNGGGKVLCDKCMLKAYEIIMKEKN